LRRVERTPAAKRRARNPAASAIEPIRTRWAFSSSTILCRKRERAMASDRNVASKSRLSAIFAKACAQLQIGL
jgi:hypothetical protein